MTEWAIIAEFPFEIYRGRTGDEGTDPVPAPARLHGALLCAAAQGTRAEVVDGELHPRALDLAALRWLEDHPPTGVFIPPTRTTPPRVTTVYRDDGVMKKEGSMSGPAPKKVGRQFSGTVAVRGSFAWTWRDEPPTEVAESFSELVGDVPYLGTSESPVRLRVATAKPNYELKSDATLMSGAGEDLDVAVAGRTSFLLDSHAAEQRSPKLSEDKYTSSEVSRRRPGWRTSRAPMRYISTTDEEDSTSPWATVLLAAIDGDVPACDRVRYAVAVHRQLIHVIGDGAPSILTGAYPPGSTQPANRVAIQVLDPFASTAAALPNCYHLAVLLPRTASALDLAVVTQAVTSLRPVHRKRLTPLSPRSGGAFWPAELRDPAAWRVDPVAVPDVRAQGRDWSLQDVVQVSLGMVLRDTLVPELPTGRTEQYRALHAAVAAQGVDVLEGDFLRISDVSPYVHKAPERGVVRPYEARLTLGQLSTRAILAIGQSRHLGGGLLVPEFREATP